MNIDYNAIATWTAVFTAFIAIVALWAQNQQSRFILGVDLILKLDERFKNEEMVNLRKSAAKSLLNKDYSDVHDVLEFFEMIGLLTRCGALDEKMVWHTFIYWIHGYWCAANEYIISERKMDPTMWEDFSYLHKRVVAIEKRKRKCSDSEISPNEGYLEEFIQEEANL